MNKIILVGRLAQDPEIRYTQSGKAIASFSVAVNRPGSNQQTGQQRETDFIPVIAWEKLAEICGNNLTKGRRILVEGRLQVRSYEIEGQKRRIFETVAQNIEFLDPKIKVSHETSIISGPEKTKIEASSFGSEVFPEEEIPF